MAKQKGSDDIRRKALAVGLSGLLQEREDETYNRVQVL